MSSYSVAETIVTISENPEVYITESSLVIKGKEFPIENIRECRVEEIDSFLETDLFYSNEDGPGQFAFKGLKWLLGIAGTLNFFRDFAGETKTPASTDQTQPGPNMDANPPLYCLSLLTRDDRIQVLPSINRLLLLDLAAKINQESGAGLEANAA